MAFREMISNWHFERELLGTLSVESLLLITSPVRQLGFEFSAPDAMLNRPGLNHTTGVAAPTLGGSMLTAPAQALLTPIPGFLHGVRRPGRLR